MVPPAAIRPTNAHPAPDSSLPSCRELYRTDAALRRECDEFLCLRSKARAAGRDPAKLSNGLLLSLVFQPRNAAGRVGAESLAALGRRGKVRPDLCNDDVRAVVADLLSFAVSGGVLDEEELAAREAAFSAAVGGRATAVFRRLVAVAFPAQACAVLFDADLFALLRALADAGRTLPPRAGGTWLARCREVHGALAAEWAWPDAAVRSVLARRLAAAAVDFRPHGRKSTTPLAPLRTADARPAASEAFAG